jgi:hypothetical protein
VSDTVTQSVYDAAGLGGPLPLGRRPAILVVDLSLGFTDPASPLGSDSVVLCVPRECVGDRAAAPHEASLVDIHAKYADVVSLDDTLGHQRSLA